MELSALWKLGDVPGISGYVHYGNTSYASKSKLLFWRSNNSISYLNNDQPVPSYETHEQQEHAKQFGGSSQHHQQQCRAAQQQHLVCMYTRKSNPYHNSSEACVIDEKYRGSGRAQLLDLMGGGN